MAELREWSWVEFILGWINKQLLIWCASTVFVFLFLDMDIEKITEKIKLALVIVWGAISFFLFFYKAIHVLIENGKLNIEAKASVGLSKDIKENKG